MKGLPKKVNFFRPAPNIKFTKTKIKSFANFTFKRPLTTFFTVILLLAALIVVGNILRKPKPEPKKPEKEPQKVQVFRIGVAPKIDLEGQVEKSGVVKITAQTPGIVQKVSVTEGQLIQRGTNLISLSTNYQGGNLLSAQRQLAGRQYQNIVNTFQAQKDLIAKQKELAEKTETNAQDLRDITAKSKDETNSLITLNKDILSTLDTNIKDLEDANANGANDQLILQAKQLKSQLLAGTNQARASLRSAEFQSGSDNPPAQISQLQKDITKKQLDLQEKTLELNRDTALIQLKIAQINETTMFPTTPFEATVQRVHVKVGQSVTQGTTLVTLSGTNQTSTVIARVPANIAKRISKLDPSIITIDQNQIPVEPAFISTEATDGQLYSVIFPIPASYQSLLTDKSTVKIEVPIGYADASKADPFLPLDAIHQTQDEAFVYVVEGNKAQSVKVKLGAVSGSFIEVLTDFGSANEVILSRNIVAGDKVAPE